MKHIKQIPHANVTIVHTHDAWNFVVVLFLWLCVCVFFLIIEFLFV